MVALRPFAAAAAAVAFASTFAFAQGAPAQNRVPDLPGRAPAAPPKREAPAADAKKKNVGGGAKLKEEAADDVLREAPTAVPGGAKAGRPPVRAK
jgi:hypothetical protein